MEHEASEMTPLVFACSSFLLKIACAHCLLFCGGTGERSHNETWAGCIVS